MFWFKSFKELPLPASEYIIQKYKFTCDNCPHPRNDHICRWYVDHWNTYYGGCSICDCEQFKPLSPLQLAVLIEEELERRKK